MNFKEIRLVGFKSFADKTTIRFDDGVTCIVGPNGCGKSNVADAVRWVLGEQSAKNLRGSSMQDVIFNGSETRRQLSFCEVTLVFDNSRKIFDIEYEEVAMTRRLYRSGESEYLINNRPCRMRDIVKLLHGVGIGKEGYSIIGQGKVAQIMNSKPVERRAIFEEATGVIKFKAQKAEIERKLDGSRENLTVFIQRMDEAETQLRPLEKQADTARKYREYSEQLKYEEVNAYLVRSDTFEQETASYRAKIDGAEKSLSEAEARLAALDGEEDESRAGAYSADIRLKDINERLRLFEVGIERKSGEVKVVHERLEACRHQLEQAKAEIEEAQKRSGEIDGLIAQSGKRKQDGEDRLNELAALCKDLMRKLAEADLRIATYEKISDEKRASQLSSAEDLASLQKEAGSLSAKRDLTQDRIEEVKEAIKKAELRRAEYARQLTECQKQKAVCEAFLNNKGDEERDLQMDISDLMRSEKKLSEEIAACNTDIASLKNQHEMLVGLKNRFDGYRDSVKKLQLDAKRNPDIGKRIVGAIADIVTTEKKYEVAIETAFGAAMQNLVVETPEDGRFLIEYLKRTGGGVVTFLPVSVMRPINDTREIQLALKENGAIGLANDLVRYNPYYANVIKHLLGNTLICDTIASATNISKKYPRAFRIIALDGDVISTSGSMTGGSRRRDSSSLLAGERNIKECEDNIARKQAALVKLKQALASATGELEEARKAYETFRTKVQEETANFAALSQKEMALAELIADAQGDADQYNTQLIRLTQQASDLEGEVLTAAESEELLAKIRAEAAEEAQERTVQIEKFRKNRDEIAETLHGHRVEEATVTSALAAEDENVRRLREERAELSVRIEQQRAAVRESEDRIRELRDEEERVALTEDEQHTLNKLRSDLRSVEERKRVLTERQQKIAEEKRSLLEKQSALTEEKHEAEIAISRSQTILENMKVRLEESYGLDYEAAQALRDPDYDFSQANANINSLRHKIAALGPVNQNAEEDYNALLARYNDMKTQREDLEKGISDLTQVLNDLRDTMQKQFDDGFNRINANFTQIFKELFGGGKAEMQLDLEEEADPLEAGVEIVACPPGKKLSKISLLSGGEQAFTAIAILFAILKSSPMPFCILDEIEAALDEANVDRFAKYLKKFSKETQFIVITHRKHTMTQADTLFGVTMEEKGVSKLVSVKLSEVEERLGGDTVIA